MKPETWKTIAIVCIVAIVAETAFVGWMWKIGTDYIDNKNECAVDICGQDSLSDSFFYDDTTKTCYCMDNGEVTSLRRL